MDLTNARRMAGNLAAVVLIVIATVLLLIGACHVVFWLWPSMSE